MRMPHGICKNVNGGLPLPCEKCRSMEQKCKECTVCGASVHV